MKTIKETIAFSLCFVTFVIGIHQTMTYGIAASYFIFMLSVGLLFLYRYLKVKRTEKEEKNQPKRPSKRKTKR